MRKYSIFAHHNITTSRSGGIGRRAGFKIQFWQQSAGSIPAFGTILSPGGGIGRRARFRCVCLMAWGFESPPGHQRISTESIDSVLFIF